MSVVGLKPQADLLILQLLHFLTSSRPGRGCDGPYHGHLQREVFLESSRETWDSPAPPSGLFLEGTLSSREQMAFA